jgi:hypothetical protein
VIRPVALAILFAAGPLLAQQPERFTLAGREVAIYNLVGSLTLERGSGSEVVVTLTRSGRDADRLTIDQSELRGIPVLRVVYPGDRIVYPAMGPRSNSQFTIRDDGTWDGNDWGRRRNGSRRIEVAGSGSGLEASARLQVSIPTGKKVAVYLGVGTVDVANVDGVLSVDVQSADITSRGTRGTLSLETGSGDIEASGHDGALSLETGSGDVEMTGQKNGTLSIETGSGSVRGTGLSATSLDVETGSGDIRLTEVSTLRASLETGSGSIEVRFLTAIEDLEAETGSGDIALRLPEGVNATVDLETSSGDLTVDFPVQLIRKEENSLRGRLGDGKGRITVESGSGDISLLK